MIKEITLGVILALLAYYDWKQRRCPNPIVLIGCIIGLFFAYSSSEIFSSIRSGIITFGFYFLFWMFGGVSEGDVKTLMMISLFVGFWNVAEYVIVASVLICIWMLYRKFIRRRIDNVPMISFVFISYVFLTVLQGI